MKTQFLIAATFGGLTLAACATKADPAPAPVETPVVQAPAPVERGPVFEPAPPPPAAEPAPFVDTTPFDPNAPIPGSAEDFAYSAGGEPRVFFGYDRYDLSEDARNSLRSQADWLNQYGSYTAVVEGHADERGTREYNLALAARRADSVKSFLVSQGVSPSRLTSVSYGKERPIDGRSSESGWSRNRNGFTSLQLGGDS